MPTNSPVYQPTTVTYESTSPPESWTNRPVSYLSATVARTTRGPCGSPCLAPRGCFPHALLALGLLTFISGIIMLVEGTIEYTKVTRRHSETTGEIKEIPGDTGDLIVAIAGGVFVCAGLILIGVYIRSSRFMRTCCRTGKDLDTIRGQASTMNPSTDLLVAAQYAPVSEVAYQPPQPMQEDTDTERSKLMQPDNKDCYVVASIGGRHTLTLQSILSSAGQSIDAWYWRTKGHMS